MPDRTIDPQRRLIPAGAGRTRPYRAAARPTRAHPRWRGADGRNATSTKHKRGSSPLARGGPGRRLPEHQPVRLIPAGAGRTRCCSRSAPGQGAHPRWRGADMCRTIRKDSASGSSPLARGGRRRRHLEHPDRGLIPAGAGRTSRQDLSLRRTRAHPRWRGADGTVSITKQGRVGSSPLARGGPGDEVTPPVLPGLIPAGAGQTSRHGTAPTMRRAHPRWRRADRILVSIWGDGDGSSPLARGGHLPGPVLVGERGLIPAGTGRTMTPRCSSSHWRAHPRWRGADADVCLAHGVGSGSSPLARGGHGPGRPNGRRGGLIPAGAGRTSWRTSRTSWSWAHPRWRGADGRSPGIVQATRGSSPLARGGRAGAPP